MKSEDKKNKEAYGDEKIPDSNKVENQNNDHNVKKEILGPNTKR